ncbi:hypothetical protein K438DRAFT_1626547 [Mycena galopus ATCC 62051]|nr:hypothetical protein K438DRAFT_1626547 [Mycena galopus ATCC 62051]
MGTEKKQRSPPLRRGKACFNCRYVNASLTWLCLTGFRPICGPCTRLPKEQACAYSDTMSRTQELEHTVHRLQSRLNELQNGAGPSRYPGVYPLVGLAGPSSNRSAASSPLSESSSSDSQPLIASEKLFLRRAKQYISTAISAHTHPTHLLHTIQAQVLLSTYLLRGNRFLEAEFYANGAATLAVGYHSTRSAQHGCYTSPTRVPS